MIFLSIFKLGKLVVAIVNNTIADVKQKKADAATLDLNTIEILSPFNSNQTVQQAAPIKNKIENT